MVQTMQRGLEVYWLIATCMAVTMGVWSSLHSHKEGPYISVWLRQRQKPNRRQSGIH